MTLIIYSVLLWLAAVAVILTFFGRCREDDV